MDVEHLEAIRDSVAEAPARGDRAPRPPRRVVLDVAPQVHAGVRPLLPEGSRSRRSTSTRRRAPPTPPTSAATNPEIPSGRFDCVFCTEVLEHTLQPFDAARELHRMLAPGGHLVLTTPFNFRIHGPLPDCWRFTEHGLRALLADFEIVELDGRRDARTGR